MIRILIASHDELMNARLVRSFESRDAVEAAASASDGLDALDLAWEFQPNVVVVGQLRPPLGGRVLLSLIKDALPRALLVVLAAPQFDASRLPDVAHAYLRHDCGEALELVSVIDRVGWPPRPSSQTGRLRISRPACFDDTLMMQGKIPSTGADRLVLARDKTRCL